MFLVTRVILAWPSIIAGLVLVALVLTAAFGGRRSVFGAVLLAGFGVLWLLVNKPMEGATLLPLTRGNGVTTADLAGVTAVAVALWRAGAGLRHRLRTRPGRHGRDRSEPGAGPGRPSPDGPAHPESGGEFAAVVPAPAAPPGSSSHSRR